MFHQSIALQLDRQLHQA